jgi:hypothetical protein
MPQVSGGGVYSDLQQAIRRQRGDPNGQRDPVERALPWLTLGLALAAVIAIWNQTSSSRWPASSRRHSTVLAGCPPQGRG